MKRLSFSYKNYYKCKTVKTGKCHLSVPMYFASILMFIKTFDNRIIDILFCFLWSSAIYRMTCENVETTVFFYPSIYHAYIHPSSSFNLLFCHTKTTQTNWVIVLNAVTTSHLTAALFPKGPTLLSPAAAPNPEEEPAYRGQSWPLMAVLRCKNSKRRSWNSSGKRKCWMRSRFWEEFARQRAEEKQQKERWSLVSNIAPEVL